MNDDAVQSITITKEVPFVGPGDSLENRLRRVALRGFPEVQIYKNARFSFDRLSPDQIARTLYTPQPHILQPYLARVNDLANLFKRKGINIFHLDHAYDYTATAADGTQTEWTMMPPVVERFHIPQHSQGGFDYQPLVGPELTTVMRDNGWDLNPITTATPYLNDTDTFSLINDGSHRVHAGLENGAGITMLTITGMTAGFPYYAIPQHYSQVQVFPSKEEADDLKIHVLTAPAHKQLYRVFPSGGIMTGNVREARPGEEII